MVEVVEVKRTDNPLSDFKLARYRFVLRLAEPARLDHFLGNILRGLVKKSLFNTTCKRLEEMRHLDKYTDEDIGCHSESGKSPEKTWIEPDASLCGGCAYYQDCAYGYCAETIAFEKRPDGSSHHPHPFVLEPPPPRIRTSTAHPNPVGRNANVRRRGSREKRLFFEYKAGEIIPFGLVLIGKGLRFRDEFIEAIWRGGEEGIGVPIGRRKERKAKYNLVKISSGDGGRVLSIPWADNEIKPEVITFRDLAAIPAGTRPERLELRFVTPAHIKIGGQHYTNRIDFETFMKRLLDRISDLSLNHCRQPFLYQYLLPGLNRVKTTYCELEEHWWHRESSRQKGKLTHRGVLGRIVFEGDLAPYVPFIRLGEYIHVGNMTSFGWGQYEICALD